MHGPPRGGAHGAFKQHAQSFAQGARLALIHMPKQGRHVPCKADARIFGGCGYAVVGLAYQMLQVEGRARLADAGLLQRLARIVDDLGHVARSAEHVFGILAYGGRQRAVAERCPLAHEAVKRRAQHIFPHAGVGAGGGFLIFCARGIGGWLGVVRDVYRQGGKVRCGFGRCRGRQQTQVGVVKRSFQIDGAIVQTRAYQGSIQPGDAFAGGCCGFSFAGRALARLGWGFCLGDVARQACSRNKQGAQRRAPQGRGGQQIGRVAVIKAHDARNNKQGRYKAAQQKAAGTAKAHNGPGKRAQRKNGRARGPKGEIADAPAKTGKERQQGQRRARQRKQHKLRVQQGRAPPRAHEVTPHVGQKHEGQTRCKHGQRLCERNVSRPVGGHAQHSLQQRHAHVQGCPDAPLAPLGEAAQQAQQHDHPKGQKRRSARKAAQVGGGVLRRAQHGRKPETRQAVKAYVAGNSLCARLRQQQNIAVGGQNLAPFHAVAKGGWRRFVQHRVGWNVRPQVQQHCLRTTASGQGGQGKAQPRDPGHAGQGLDVQRFEHLAVGGGCSLLNIHGPCNINKILQIRQQRHA